MVWVCRGSAGIFVAGEGCSGAVVARAAIRLFLIWDLRSQEFSLLSCAFWKEGEIKSTA